MNTIYINGQDLTLEQVVLVARKNYQVKLDDETKRRVLKSRAIVDDIVKDNKVIYGITTGI